jgi:uncharacterized membrane protein
VNRVLWVLQILLGVYFVAVGVMHFVVPDGLPAQMEWMYELSDSLHLVSGVAEILGGLGLILPGLTGIRPELTAWAGAGLAVVMVGALVWHVTRGEYGNIAFNLVLAALTGFIAYRRFTTHPLRARAAA